MAQRAGKVDAASLMAVALPKATATYTVISHEFLINTTRTQLAKLGFDVKKEVYKANANGEVATAQYRIEYGSDPDLGMLFTWANSYDKSMKFKCAVGGFVRASGASVISDTINNYNRKHTGSADAETQQTIIDQIAAAEAYFSQLCRDKDMMKAISITHREMAEIVGILYFEMGLISGEQATIIKNEYKKPRFEYTTGPESLWSCYNHILVSLAKSNPKNWMDQQRMVHMFITDHVGIQKFDSETEEPEVGHPGPEVIPPLDQLEEMAKATNTVSPIEMKEEEEPGHDYKDQVDALDYLEEAEIPDEFKSVSPEEEQNVDELPDVTTVTEKLTVDQILEKYGDNLSKEEIQKIRDMSGEKSYQEEIAEICDAQNALDAKVADLDQEEDDDWDKHGMVPFNGEEPLEENETVMEIQPIMMTRTDIESIHPGTEEGSLVILTMPEGDVVFEVMAIDGDTESWALLQQEVVEDGPAYIEQIKAEGKAEEVAAIDTPTLPKPATIEDLNEEPISSEEEAPAEINVDAVEAEGLKPMPIMSHEDIEIIPPAEDVADDLDPIRQKIQAELLDIYGSIKEFAFEKKDSQYNVTLVTGEVVILMETEVEVK